MKKQRSVAASTKIITAVIERGEAEGLGIAIGLKNGRPVITHIHKGGAVAATALLQVGMVILSVDHETCATLPIEDVRRLLQNSTRHQRSITITAESLLEQLASSGGGSDGRASGGLLVAAVISKTSPRESVGVELDIVRGDIVITEITWDSLAYHTDLQVGMKLMSINDVSCEGKKIPQVRALFASAIPSVSILAQVREEKELYPVKTYSMDSRSRSRSKSRSRRTRGGGRVAPMSLTMNEDDDGNDEERPPPPGLLVGGYWTVKNYAGVTTMVAFMVGCFCFGGFGPIALCCPCDERHEYVVDGGAYNTEGKFLRSVAT